MLGLATYSGPAKAQAATPAILITNARLFDGLDLTTKAGVSVLVQDGMIEDVVQGTITPSEGATVIDARGRTLMPGLIDAHWQTMLAALSLATMLTADLGDIHLAAAVKAERTLMRGFTTVRDLGCAIWATRPLR